MAAYELTQAADDDLQGVAAYTLSRWGDDQVQRYGGLLKTHFKALG
jgi:plasmid stabilization system protein ParE